LLRLLDVNTMRALEDALENFGGCAAADVPHRIKYRKLTRP